MRGEWCYFKSHFTKSQCDKIVETIQKRPHKDAQIGVNSTVVSDSSFRKLKIRFVNNGDAELGYMFDEL